jgi:DNA polymerase I
MAKKKETKDLKKSSLDNFFKSKPKNTEKKEFKISSNKDNITKKIEQPDKINISQASKNIIEKKIPNQLNVDQNNTKTSKQKLEIVSKQKLPSQKDYIDKNSHLLLLTSYYNPKTNKATLGFYDKDEEKIIHFDDHTDHKPYFIIKFSSDQAWKFLSIHPEFSRYKTLIIEIEDITITDRLFFKNIQASRIITQTPADVPKIRKLLQEQNIETFESEIRYHLNYLFDRNLIPGMHYEITENGFFHDNNSPKKSQIPRNEAEKSILESFKSNQRYKEIIDDFLPLFTEDIPELLFYSFDIEVSSPRNVFPKVNDAAHPISSIAISSSKGKGIVLFNNFLYKDVNKNLRHENLPENIEVRIFESEFELLTEFFNILENISILISYNGNEFDIPYLINRSKTLKVKNKLLTYDGRLNVGRFDTGLHIDLYNWFSNPAIRLYAYSGVYKDLKLDTVASSLLNKTKYDYEGTIWDLSGKELIYYNWFDSQITLELLTHDNNSSFNIMVLLGRITHVPLDELVNRQVSSWLQYFFQFEHRKRNYLIPNKNEIREFKGMTATSQALSKDKKFQGAIVIDPEKGIHFDVTVLDFASLYPSIISSKNLSYETINCGHSECFNNIIPGTKYYSCTLNIGIISQLIGFLKDIRVEWFKKLSKSSKIHPDAEFYKIIEKSLKVLINAAYGVLGAEFFSFYCLPVAESTTAVGRHLIEKTVDFCGELGVKVLYGDTDSVFLETPSKEVITKIINWSHEELGIPLEIDKEYKYITFSDRKKNYFGVMKTGQLDIKGLMGKKSNVPKCIQDYFTLITNILQEVSSPLDIEKVQDKIKTTVLELFNRIDKSKKVGMNKQGFSIEDLAFTIQLTKYTYQYESKNIQHVRAAIKYEEDMRSKGNKDFKLQPGQFISYLKGKDDVLSIELVKPGFILDVSSYRSQIESTFSQILESFDIDMNSLQKKVNLMDFI